MTAWVAREHHRFEAAGKPFVYLVPSAAIFALDDAADAVLRKVSTRPHTREELLAALRDGERSEGRASSASTPDFDSLDATLAELARVRAIGEVNAPQAPQPKVIPLAPFPLTTMVLNVTNQCNFSCSTVTNMGKTRSSTPRTGSSRSS